MRTENFLEGVWLGRGEEKKCDGTQLFSLQNGKKTKGESVIC